jgi:hypothetical protein
MLMNLFLMPRWLIDVQRVFNKKLNMDTNTKSYSMGG